MRDKCAVCGDKIFKIVDGIVMCRKRHPYGRVELEGGTKVGC